MVYMAKILLLARLTPHCGNLTTAKRIKDHLTESGHTCELQNTEFFDGLEHFRCYIAENGFRCVIGIHLWRAGLFLTDCPVPFSMIFGGTDLNEHIQDSKKFRLMTRVVGNAKNLVAFSQTLAFKAEELWPSVKSKLVIQPQAVLTCSASRNQFNEVDFFDKMRECATPTESLHLRTAVCGSLIIFLLVAGLRPVKDPTFPFKVISEWHKEDPNVFLIVVGPELDVAFSKKVKELAKECPGVLVMSALYQSYLHAAVQRFATAVVNTSISEGMAASILEAMDLGTVVLARKNPGNETIIEHGENGLLFQTPKEFLYLAKQVAYDEKYRNRLTLAGKKYISNNHSLHSEKDTYKSLVRTLIEPVE